MLPEVRGQLKSMSNHKINQCLKAFSVRYRRIQLALICCKEPHLVLLLLSLMDDVFNCEFTYTEDNALAESAETSIVPKLTSQITFA